MSIVHTLEILRKEYPILLSAVACVAARHTRPTLYQSLLTHTQTVIGRAILTGKGDTALVQAILLLVYYQPPSDSSTWMRIGAAIRLGYQLRWHVPRCAALPEDVKSQRLVLVSLAAAMSRIKAEE